MLDATRASIWVVLTGALLLTSAALVPGTRRSHEPRGERAAVEQTLRTRCHAAHAQRGW